MGRWPRISRALRRNRNPRSPVAIGVLLFAALTAQIFSLERTDPRAGDCRSSCASLEFSRGVQRNVAGNILADLLDDRRIDFDVGGSFKACRSNFPGDSAAVFVGRCTNLAIRSRGKKSRAKFALGLC